MLRPGIARGMMISDSRVKSGCGTCKVRRVRCDEGKPHCQRCTTAGRACQGYSPHQQLLNRLAGRRFIHYLTPRSMAKADNIRVETQVPTFARSLSLYPDIDHLALRSLKFYVECVALQLGDRDGIQIFSKGLLQLMHSSTAVRHCLVALALFQEGYLLERQSELNQDRINLALSHYNQSIRDVVQLNRESPGQAALITLTTCVLYCAIEFLQGNLASGMKHVEAGVRLLRDQEPHLLRSEQLGFGADVGFTTTLKRLFAGLDSQKEGIQDKMLDACEVAYLYALVVAPVKPVEFSTPEQAFDDYLLLHNNVCLCISWADMHFNDPDCPHQQLSQIKDNLNERMSQWIAAYHKLLTHRAGQKVVQAQSQLPSLLILRVNHIVLQIDMDLQPGDTEMKYDHFLAEFQAITEQTRGFLELGQSQARADGGRAAEAADEVTPPSILTLSVGVVPALFFTATRCRDPTTRRRAVKMLQTAKRREATWDSDIVSIVAQHAVELEEAAALRYWAQTADSPQGTRTVISRAEDIPKKCRVQEMQADCGPSEEGIRTFLQQLAESRPSETFLVWDAQTLGKFFVLAT